MILNKFTKSIVKSKIFDIDVKELRGKDFHSNLISRKNFIYKKLKKYLTTKKNIRCLLCRNKLSHKNIFNRWKNYKLFSCPKCGCVCTNIDFKTFKPEFFHNLEYKKKYIKKSIGKNFKYRLSKFGNERIKYIFDNIKFKTEKPNILDFACGYGAFLYALKKKKIRSKGIDFDDDSVEFCKKLNLNVSKETISKEKDSSFDLITLFDVIEHLHQPNIFLKNAIKKLKNKGHILLFTPNINSLSNILMGHEHNNFAIFDHVCFYNEKSIKYICKRYGLKLIKFDYYGLDIKDYFQKVEYENKNFNQDILNDFSNLTQSFIDFSKASNSMRIILQKK